MMKNSIPFEREPTTVPAQPARTRESAGEGRSTITSVGRRQAQSSPRPQGETLRRGDASARTLTPRPDPAMPRNDRREPPEHRPLAEESAAEQDVRESALRPLLEDALPAMPGQDREPPEPRPRWEDALPVIPGQDVEIPEHQLLAEDAPAMPGMGEPPERPPVEALPAMPRHTRMEGMDIPARERPNAPARPAEEAPAMVEYTVPQIALHTELPVVSALTGREIPLRTDFREEDAGGLKAERPVTPPVQAHALPKTRYLPLGETAEPSSAPPVVLDAEELPLSCGSASLAEVMLSWPGSPDGGFAVLEERIRRELTDWHYYSSLGKKVGGTAAKAFTAMAADEWQCAKRLAAVYFLATGKRYWPEETDTITLPPYLTALRERFYAESEDAEHYSAAASNCRDECLREIFEETADQNRRHAKQLRLLVELL